MLCFRSTFFSAPDLRPEARLGRTGRLAVVGVWSALGLLESSKAYLSQRMAGNEPDLGVVLVANMPWWLVWAAFTPAVLYTARRFRFEHARRRALAAHGVAAVALSLLHHGIVGVLMYFTTTRGAVLPLAGRLVEATPFVQVRVFFANFFLLNLLTYAAMVGAYYGLEFYRRYRAGELRAARLEASMHLARLDALRMELNPHFLFNSLNAVAGLVRGNESGVAVEVLSRLGDLLRATLSGDEEIEVELERELDLLGAYLAIEQVRFRDRLTVDFEVEPETRSAAVPPLLMQPLVENAIRHGIARRAGPGRLTITSRTENGVLVLAVSDTGPGPGAEDPSHGNGTGVGLANVRNRLEELYGDAAALTLAGGAEEGTVATVRIPLGRPGRERIRSSRGAANPGTSG